MRTVKVDCAGVKCLETSRRDRRRGMAASLATLWSVWFPACLGEASAQQIVSTHVSASVHVSCDLNSA